MLLKSFRKFAQFLIIKIFDFFFKLTIEGKENIPSLNSKAIIIANHCSFLDVPVIGRTFSKKLIDIAWVVSKKNYKNWSLKWVYAIYKVIVVNGTVKKASEALRIGSWVVIFPEGAGKWCALGQEKPLKTGKGAATIALTTGAMIIPVGILGTEKIMPPASFRMQKKMTFRMNPLETITVRIGKPFNFPPHNNPHIEDSLLEKCTEEIMQSIHALISAPNNLQEKPQ